MMHSDAPTPPPNLRLNLHREIQRTLVSIAAMGPWLDMYPEKEAAAQYLYQPPIF